MDTQHKLFALVPDLNLEDHHLIVCSGHYDFVTEEASNHVGQNAASSQPYSNHGVSLGLVPIP